MSEILYLSPLGNDRWSGTLPEPNATETDGPLNTLARARDLVRELRRAGKLSDGFQVRLRGGRYRLQAPVVFGPDDSANVLYTAYPGEEPILDGGVIVAGFAPVTVNGTNAWCADVAEILRLKPDGFRSLFVNGGRRRRTIYPRTGALPIEDVPGAPKEMTLFAGSHSFITRAGDMKSFRNLQEIDVLVHHLWVEERMPIASWDPATRLLTSTRHSIFMLRLGWMSAEWATYRLENVFEELREPGQWYLDRLAGKLYYVPLPGETPENTTVTVPLLSQMLIFAGDPGAGQYVENLSFRGMAFEHTDWVQPPGFVPDHDAPKYPPGTAFASDAQAALSLAGVIDMVGARNITLEDCTLAHHGGYAINTGCGCVSLRLVGNTMRDLGGGGIKCHGGNVLAPRAERNGLHRITDNHIHDLGIVFKAAIGIIGAHTFGLHIAHNHIHHTEYSGISLGWVWGYGESVSCNHCVELNHIHHIGTGMLSDMGGIYTLGVQPGTVLRNNLIHDVRTHQYGGWGIYPDEGSSHLVIENNVVYNVQSGCLHVHYGREIIIRNNIFAFGGEGIVRFSRREAHRPFTLIGNILVSKGTPLFWEEYPRAVEERPPFYSDLNVLFDTSRPQPQGAHLRRDGVEAIDTLAQIRQAGVEGHSIVADPGFVDAAVGDFSLRPNSPALSHGFRPIDLSNVGPRPMGKRD